MMEKHEYSATIPAWVFEKKRRFRRNRYDGKALQRWLIEETINAEVDLHGRATPRHLPCNSGYKIIITTFLYTDPYAGL